MSHYIVTLQVKFVEHKDTKTTRHIGHEHSTKEDRTVQDLLSVSFRANDLNEIKDKIASVARLITEQESKTESKPISYPIR